MLLVILISLATSSLLVYLWVQHKYSHWSKLGVNGPKPSLRHFGTTTEIQGGDPMKVELDLLKRFGSVYGTYIGVQPSLTISDPELIKAVLVRDFQCFVNRRPINSDHPVFNNSLFFASGELWKKLRQIASPTFTSGRLKRFVPLMNRSIGNLEAYFDKLTEETNHKEGGIMKDTRTTIMGFTIETIASTMFSAQTGSNESSTEERASPSANLFIKHALQISEVSNLVILCNNTLPKWFNSRVLGIEHQFNVESSNFYINVTKAIISGHQKQQQAHESKAAGASNFVQLLMKVAQKNQYFKEESYEGLTASMEQEFKESSASKKSLDKPSLTENEIIGVAAGVFLAGFDTLSAITSSALYELALHEQIQERLFQELSANLDSLDPNSEEYIEVAMKLPYLDCVIKETLRKYPVLARLERRVNVENYSLGEQQKIPLVKDQVVEISTIALHYNEQLHPEPFRFNPDRLGMRFAYQEMKLCLSRILRRYRFLTTPDTPRHLTFLPFKFVLLSEPYPLKVIKRN
ncbi:Thromboxane-A synthase [Tyrophagus putrescentiae]|nr:Thromboxane-A synthase [Tyrophagus putrescentiae]